MFVLIVGVTAMSDMPQLFEWTVHGKWSERRSFMETYHVSCTVPIFNPMKTVAVTLKSEAPIIRVEVGVFFIRVYKMSCKHVTFIHL